MRHELLELTVDESLELIGQRGRGRLAVDDGAGPVILPTDYLFQRGVLHIRTGEGTKLAAADRRAPACFEVDVLPSTGGEGWSVLLRGRLRRFIASEATDGQEPTPTAAGDRHHLIGLTPTRISGRRLVPTELRDPGRLTVAAAQELLARNHVGRLGFVHHGQPVLLPVNYTLDREGAVVFRTTRGSKLSVAANEIAHATFEVDEYDEASGRGVAVVVRGRMVAVVELVDLARLGRLGLTTFADAVDRENWIRVRAGSIEGWVFSDPRRRVRT